MNELEPPKELAFTDAEKLSLSHLVHADPLLLRFYLAAQWNHNCWVAAMLKVGELTAELERLKGENADLEGSIHAMAGC